VFTQPTRPFAPAALNPLYPRLSHLVSQATTPPYGDYDYAYANNGGVEHNSYQQQGEELGYGNDNGYVNGDGRLAGAASTDVPQQQAFGHDGGSLGGSVKDGIQRRAVSVGNLFGRPTAATVGKRRTSDVEVRTVFDGRSPLVLCSNLDCCLYVGAGSVWMPACAETLVFQYRCLGRHISSVEVTSTQHAPFVPATRLHNHAVCHFGP